MFFPVLITALGVFWLLVCLFPCQNQSFNSKLSNRTKKSFQNTLKYLRYSICSILPGNIHLGTLLSILVAHQVYYPANILKLPSTKILGILSPLLICQIFCFLDTMPFFFLASSLFTLLSVSEQKCHYLIFLTRVLICLGIKLQIGNNCSSEF